MPISKINTTSITDNSVTAGKIVADAVTSAKIPDNAIDTVQIADDAVTSAKLDTNIDISGTLDVTGVTTLDGNVGIGATPSVKLDVSGPSGVTSFTGSTALGIVTKGSTGLTDYSGIDFRGNNQTIPTARIAVLNTSGGSKLQFGTSNNYSGSGSGITNTAVTIDAIGNVGVGTSSPITLSGNATPGLTVTSNGPYILLQDANNANQVRYMSNNSGELQFGKVNDDGSTSKTEHMKISSDGIVTMPKQPAFLAKLSTTQTFPASTLTTVLLNSEIFDLNSDYDTSTYTFTAPVTGKYLLSAHLLLQAVDTGPSYYQLSILTSNALFYDTYDPRQMSGDSAYQTLAHTALADMDAGDTATVRIYQEGGVTNQTSLNATTTDFSGYLVA